MNDARASVALPRTRAGRGEVRDAEPRPRWASRRSNSLALVADWQQLLNATKALDLPSLDEHLRAWNDRLVPTVESLVRARTNAETGSTKDEDVAFFKDIYKWHSGSGGQSVSGRICFLSPYLGPRDVVDVAQLTQHLRMPASSRVPRVLADSFPSGLTTVPFVWKYFGANLPMKIHVGFDTPRMIEPETTVGQVLAHVGAWVGLGAAKGPVVECTHAFAVEYVDEADKTKAIETTA